MITNYFRPQTLDEALKLLAQPDARPLGGGTWLNQPHDEKFSVVDLQALGLNKIHKAGNNLEIDACVTLQHLLESTLCPVALTQAVRLESALNIRNMATVAGALVACGGRSTFATAMLALDVKLTVDGGPRTEAGSSSAVYGLVEYLTMRPPGLITKITIPLNARLAFESVARSPMDQPIVCASIARWAAGRTRLALGGTGNSPTLAMDGIESDGIEASINSAQAAAKNAFHGATDEWASAEYRMDVAATLAKRCLETVK
jgi:aerobic carbon-monoxide dehydrogenase medium subunit